MASSSESSSSSPPEKVAHEEEEEEEGGAADVRSEQLEKRTKKTKKKKSSGGGTCDRLRQGDVLEEVDGKVGSDSGDKEEEEEEEEEKEDEGHKEEGSADDDSPSRKSARDSKKTIRATEQQKTSTSAAAAASADKEDQLPAKETEKSDEAWEHDRQPPITGPVNVVYCGVCGMPPDYCEFGSQWKRCKAWLEQHHPELLRYALPPEELAAAGKDVSGEKSGSTSGHGADGTVASDGTSGHPNSNTSTADTAGDLAQQFAENLRLSAAATQQAAAALGLDAADDLSPDTQAAEAKKKPAKGKAPAQPAVVTIQRQSRAKRKTMTVIVGLDFFGVKLSNATKIFSKRFACGASVSKNPLGHPPQQVEVQGDVEEAIVEVIESVFSVPADKIVLLPRK